MTNAQVAQVFLRIAELMSYRDESTFKIRAYYQAALTLLAVSEPLADISSRDELKKLQGIGDAIEGKIVEILTTGTCNLYDRLKSEVSPEIQELLRVPGLTPRLVRMLERDFAITTVEGLFTLAQSGGLADLDGATVKVEDAAQMLRAAEAMGALDEE